MILALFLASLHIAAVFAAAEQIQVSSLDWARDKRHGYSVGHCLFRRHLFVCRLCDSPMFSPSLRSRFLAGRRPGRAAPRTHCPKRLSRT